MDLLLIISGGLILSNKIIDELLQVNFSNNTKASFGESMMNNRIIEVNFGELNLQYGIKIIDNKVDNKAKSVKGNG